MHRSKVVQWFVIWLGAMVVLIIVTQPEERPDKLAQIGFNTTESAELYFRNVRTYHYLHQQEGGDIFDVYRLKSLFEGNSQPMMPFVIYNNWRANEAFIRLDTVYHRFTLFHAVIDSAGMSSRAVALPDLYNESQFDYARAIYRALRDECEVGMAAAGQDTLWLRGDERKATKRVLTDYFRLIGKL